MGYGENGVFVQLPVICRNIPLNMANATIYMHALDLWRKCVLALRSETRDTCQ